MDLGDVYQIRIRFDLTDGEVADTAFYYRCIDASPTSHAIDVWNNFNDGIVSLFPGLMDEDYTVATGFVINGMDIEDFHEATVNEDGTHTGGQLPTFITASVRSARQGPGFKHSHRALPFGNVTDIAASQGQWNATFISAMGTLIAKLNDDLLPIGGADLEPVQLAGPFLLTIPPVVKQVLDGTWQFNTVPSVQRTRQVYQWV